MAERDASVRCPGRARGSRWARVGVAVALLTVGGFTWRFARGERPEPVRMHFRDVTEDAGIRFRHTHGGCGERRFPEMFSSGCAWVDADGDGFLDLLFVDGAPLPGCPDKPHGARLYRSLRNSRFEDWTAASGIRDRGYGLGCTVGDYDNDGDSDLYITHLGGNSLYRNDGRGHFTEVAHQAGVRCGRFSTSCAFADYDRDGDLDLYVCNYSEYETADDLKCRPHRDVPTYCRPALLKGQQDVLYRNNGDGTFTDVSRAAGIELAEGRRALGVIWSDLDDDGDMDLYVANDMDPNSLFRNNGNGTFTEIGAEAGAAVPQGGKVHAGMGVGAADVDGDGQTDLVVTNFSNEQNTVYRNVGSLRFEDRSVRSGLGGPSLPFLGFGAVFADFDLDGDPDLFVANGHVWDEVAILDYGLTYGQRDLLFQNQGNGRFREVGAACGAYFQTDRVGRGAAAGDYDNDGDPDLVVSNSNQPPSLLRSGVMGSNHWIQLRLAGTRSNRDGIGARVWTRTGARTQVAEVTGGGSYCSQGSYWLTVGLGASAAAREVRIRWPSGATETLGSLAAGRAYRVIEGAGRAEPLPSGPVTPAR